MELRIQKEQRDMLLQTSWTVLRPDARELMCRFLDEELYIRTSNKVFRDWRGLVQLANMNNNEMLPREMTSPTKHFLTFLTDNQEMVNWSLWDLLQNLEAIDRHDVIEKMFENRTNSSISILLEDGYHAQKIFDTIVLSAKEDSDFAADLIRRMSECNLTSYHYNQKIAEQPYSMVTNKVKPCHMVKHDVASILSNQGCQKVIAIFSPEFLKSDAYYFLLNDVYGQFGGHGLDIIPIIWRKCEIENLNFRYLASIKYTVEEVNNFYERLFCKTLGVNEEVLTKKLTEFCFLDDEPTVTITRTTDSVVNHKTESPKVPLRDKIVTRLKCVMEKLFKTEK